MNEDEEKKLAKKTKMAILGVVLSAIFWPTVIILATRETDQARITRIGSDDVATIVSMVDRHETKHDSRPLMRVTVERFRGGARTTSVVEQRMTDAELARYAPGVRVAIKFDPDEPESIAVVGLAPADASAP